MNKYEEVPEILKEQNDKKGKKIPRAMPVTPRSKIGRNQPCPCRSGKKFKKCCATKREYTPGG